jgi:hypothetical protein
MAKKINLGDYADPGVGLLAGQERGKRVREKERLDAIDRGSEIVHIIIPEQIYTVASSFFLGMFAPSVELLGEKRFREKYIFEGPDADEVLDQGIRQALLSGSPFQFKKQTA